MKRMRGAALLVVVLVVAGIVLLVSVFVIDGSTCSGSCASVACSETAPCTINGTLYTIGQACAPGVAGTVCEDNWWPFADCTCVNAIGQGNVARSLCFK